mgnify:CR=1 FL=1
MKNEIYPCLWFNNNAKEAAEFYTSVFSDSGIISESEFAVALHLSGQRFLCLNGGPQHIINPSISFYAIYEKEKDLDRIWKKLSGEGFIMMPYERYEWSEKYGWVQDKFGVSWQLSLGKIGNTGQRFTPSLLFTGTNSGKTEEAIHFYTSVFKNSEIIGILKYKSGENDIDGNVKHAQFTLGKSMFMAMDSSYPHKFTFSEGVSFVVECDTQEEIDYFWDKLTEGGHESMCGWLQDSYGVSWQIIPSILEKLMSTPDKAHKVTEAFLKMKKFDIEKLLIAAEQGEPVQG